MINFTEALVAARLDKAVPFSGSMGIMVMKGADGISSVGCRIWALMHVLHLMMRLIINLSSKID